MSFVKPSVLLCVLLVVAFCQAAAGEAALRLSRATSKVNERNTFVTFTLKFKAAQEPEILWWQTNRDDPYQATTTFSEGRGTTKVKLSMKGGVSPRINLDIGDLGGQFFEIAWSVPASKNADQTLRLDQIQVEPGTDLMYRSDDEITVKLIMHHLNGYMTEMDPTDTYEMSGKWIDPTTGTVAMGENPMIPFLKLTDEAKGPSLNITLTFNTDEVKVNGLFEASVTYFVYSRDPPIQYLSDRMKFLVHEDKEGAPSAEDLLRTLESH